MSEPDSQREGLFVEFLVGHEPIPLPVLSGILSSMQQAIYIVGAHNTNREYLRGKARLQFTFGLVSAHNTDFVTHFMPLVTIAPDQLGVAGQIAINMASNALYDAAKTALSKMKDHYQGDRPATDTETARDIALWKSTCEHAENVAMLGHSVHTTLQTRDGATITMVSGPSDAKSILEWEKAQHITGHVRLRGCELRGVEVDGQQLKFRIPRYPNDPITCTFISDDPIAVGNKLQLGEKYTIVGTSTWNRSGPHQARPVRISIATIETIAGEVILTSDYDQQAERENSEGDDPFSLGEELER